jgi:hypothetical protein
VAFHSPGSSWTELPLTAVPEIVGGRTLAGASAATGGVGAEAAVADPNALFAVTAARTLVPTSAGVSA